MNECLSRWASAETVSDEHVKARSTDQPSTGIDWTGARTHAVAYGAGATIFAQGDPATSVMYIEQGAVRLSVLSHAGKEAVIAVLDLGHFFGEAVSRASRSGWPPRRP